MILIYHCISYHYRNIHSDDTWRKSYEETVRKSNKVLRATGNHTYLTITLRVTLVGDFENPFSPSLSIYYLWKLFFLQNRLSGAFQTRLLSYKEFDLLYVVSWLVVLLDYVCVSVYTLRVGTLTGILRDVS